MRYRPMLAAAILLAMAIGASAAEVFTKELDNGLLLAVKESHRSAIVTARLFVRAGSIYEEEYAGAGISHYFEHVVSGGSTEVRSEDEYTSIRQAIGGQINAYTSRDHTCYHVTTTPPHLR